MPAESVTLGASTGKRWALAALLVGVGVVTLLLGVKTLQVVDGASGVAVVVVLAAVYLGLLSVYLPMLFERTAVLRVDGGAGVIVIERPAALRGPLRIEAADVLCALAAEDVQAVWPWAPGGAPLVSLDVDPPNMAIVFRRPLPVAGLRRGVSFVGGANPLAARAAGRDRSGVALRVPDIPAAATVLGRVVPVRKLTEAEATAMEAAGAPVIRRTRAYLVVFWVAAILALLAVTIWFDGRYVPMFGALFGVALGRSRTRARRRPPPA